MTCRKKAMDYLARREHSRSELAVKLEGKGYGESEINETLNQLEKDNLQSDNRFADAYLSSRKNSGFGPVRIANELTKKGVDDILVQSTLESCVVDWVGIAREQQHKKYGRQPEDFKEKAQQARFLQYRGFTFEQINQVIDLS